MTDDKSFDLDDLMKTSEVIPGLSGDLLHDAGVGERIFASKETADIFGKTVQWLYYGEARLFFYEDGTPIKIRRNDKGWRLWTLANMRDMALACYNRKNLTELQLEAILQRIIVAEAAGDWSQIPIPEKPDK